MSNLFEDMTVQKACDTIWNYINSKIDKGVPYDDGVIKGITVHYDYSELTELDISMWYLLNKYQSAQRKIDELQKENEKLRNQNKILEAAFDKAMSYLPYNVLTKKKIIELILSEGND